MLWPHKTWTTVLVADPSGQVLLDLLRAARRRAAGDRRPAVLPLTLMTQRPMISDLTATAAARARSCAVPVLRGGQTRYVLVAEIPPVALGAILAEPAAAGGLAREPDRPPRATRRHLA